LHGLLFIFLKNFRRRLVRVLKLHSGFILIKKGDINPQKNLETPLAPWGNVLVFVVEYFKSVPRVLKLRI
jgi:hypothetical protein